MKIWNFAIIGTGLIAEFHAKAIADLDNARLVAVCDIVEKKANAFAQKYGCKAHVEYKNMLKDPDIDVVTVATPSGLHAEPVIAAAKYGKHVLCEKPLEITLERIDSMIEAHHLSGTYLGSIFPNRFNDAMLPLRNAIKGGRFGQISYAGVYVPWWRTDQYYANNWRGTWKLDGGGALMNQSIHMIDMLCDLMPPVECVQSFTATLGHDIETEDTAVAILRFAGNALGIIYGTTASYPGQVKRFEITGTEGTVVYLEDSLSVWQFAKEIPEDRHVRRQFGQIQRPGGASDPANISYEGHKRNFSHFLRAVETKTNFLLDGKEGRKAVDLILQIYKAGQR